MANRTSDSTSFAGGSREDGVVKTFNKINGYGFIKVKSRADDVYFKAEDLTPRSKQYALESTSVNGGSITCTTETFGDTRVRARYVRLADATDGVKQPDMVSATSIDLVKITAVESLQNLASSKHLDQVVQPSCKTLPAQRPPGWGRSKGACSNKSQLMDMGFSEEAAQGALATGLDINDVLETLLSSPGELESLPTTRDGSDAASDRTSSCETDSAKGLSPIQRSKGVESNSEELDEDLKASAQIEEAAWEPFGSCLAVMPLASSFGFSLSPSSKVCEVVEPVRPHALLTGSEPAKTNAPARQLARVLRSCNSAENQLSVHSGALIYTWTGTATENGWIYAERLNMGELAGWIPTNALKFLPLGHQWRRVVKSCRSFSDVHLASDEGDIILVDSQSVEEGSDGGWIHAECLDGSRTGWFPTGALEQVSAKLRWMHAVNSQAAQHEAQVAVHEGDLLLVDPETHTKEGWAYAWAVDRQHGDHSGNTGWVPVNSLAWPQE